MRLNKNTWCSLMVACSFALPQWADGGDWSRFRGPNGTGVAEGGAPTEFGENKNIKWNYELPGRGVSSPIVVGDKVFVTCYSGYGMGDGGGRLEDLVRHLVCIDRNSGEKLWVEDVPAKMPEDPYSGAGVPTHGYASHTPVSDGERVYAFFGKSGVHAFDMEGEKLWEKGVGNESPRMTFGSAASPIVFGDHVIVNASYESQAMVWLDKESGEEKIRKEAEGLGNSWTTPVVVTNGDQSELIINVPGEVWAFDAVTGEFRWYGPGPSDRNAQVSVAVKDGIVYAMGGRGGEAIAIKAGGKDDASSNIAWRVGSGAQGRYATPLVHDGHIFMFNGTTAMCFNAETGDRVFQTRMTSGQSAGDNEGGRRGGGRGGQGGGRRGGFGGGRSVDGASPVLADGKIYLVSGTGTVYVLAAKPEYELIAANDMSFDSSGFAATPAISDGQLFLRSHTHIYCIAGD